MLGMASGVAARNRRQRIQWRWRLKTRSVHGSQRGLRLRTQLRKLGMNIVETTLQACYLRGDCVFLAFESCKNSGSLLEHIPLKALAVLRNSIDLTIEISKFDFAADAQIAKLCLKSRAGKIGLMPHRLH